MLEKIVSGGQTGVDRAALDEALAAGIAVGGWCPAGRRAEDGSLPATYPLEETPSDVYAVRTAWNVRDSDGTLVLLLGTPPEGGTALTVEEARRMGKPLLVCDLAQPWDPEQVVTWMRNHAIRVLNVAGPRASMSPEIYGETRRFMRALLEAASRAA